MYLSYNELGTFHSQILGVIKMKMLTEAPRQPPAVLCGKFMNMYNGVVFL